MESEKMIVAKTLDQKTYPELELASVLVTEANEGLGLEFVRKLIELPNPPALIFATFRDEANCEELKAIEEARKTSEAAKVILVQMDVTKFDTVRKASELVDSHVGKRGLTLLINNGGIAEACPFPEITQENMRSHFAVNTLGRVMVLQEFLPLLQRSTIRAPVDKLSVSRSAVLNMCDWEASISRTGKTNLDDLSIPSSKMSKAALNMAVRIAAKLVKDQGILVVMMCPGWVQADERTKLADVTTDEIVKTILETLKSLDHTHQGNFMDSKGESIDF